MHPTANGCTYQIPNSGAGTEDRSDLWPLPSRHSSSHTCQPVSCVLPQTCLTFFPCAGPVSDLHSINYSLSWLSNGTMTFHTHSIQQTVTIFPKGKVHHICQNKLDTLFSTGYLCCLRRKYPEKIKYYATLIPVSQRVAEFLKHALHTSISMLVYTHGRDKGEEDQVTPRNCGALYASTVCVVCGLHDYSK